MTGGRMIVLSSEAMRSLQQNLYKKFSTGASVIILEMGISYGSTLFDEIYKQSKLTPDSEPVTLRSFTQILFKSGLGKIAFSGDLEFGRALEVTVNNCAFCVKNVSENECNFLRGVIMATMTKMFSKQYKSTVACSILQSGEHVCKIELVANKQN
jgi:predicted hydrocarbon binding protein